MLLINPKSPNNMPDKAIETPIWCALMAKDGDTIIDLEVELLRYRRSEDKLIVVMGNNPSASSTPKMPEAIRLREHLISTGKMGAKVYMTGLHPMASGVADIPIPHPSELVKIKRARWELLNMEKYKAHNWHCLQDIDNRGKYAALYTSYGCPYSCDFCNIHTIYGGRKVYYRNPLDVREEIDYLVRNHGIHNLKLCDELFTLNPEHVSKVCDAIKDYRLNIWAYAKVDMVTPVMLAEMKKAGVNWIAYGFESGNESVLKGVAKSYKGISETVKMTRDAGINIMGNFIFGLPGDTHDTMEQTLELSRKIRCEYVNFYCAMAYPGSKLYNGENTNWGSYEQCSKNLKPMGNKVLSPQEVLDFRNVAFYSYFTDGDYLSMVNRKFGEKAMKHIQEMVISGY